MKGDAISPPDSAFANPFDHDPEEFRREERAEREREETEESMKTQKPILAIMQNMWVRDPERIKEAIEGSASPFEMRLALIERLLFMGCLTGRRLRAAFGDLLPLMVWEESTPEIADNPRTIFPADPMHLEMCVGVLEPRVVITFGKIAGNAIGQMWKGPLVKCPHPAARQADTAQRLAAAAAELRQALTLSTANQNENEH